MANIWNSNSNSLVVGTAEDDYIGTFGGSFVTIDGSEGNDDIDNYGVIENYGVDTIIGSNDNLISGADGNDTISNFGGLDYIMVGGSNVTIDGGKGNDIIYNDGRNVTIDTGAGNDSICNIGDLVTINCGAGNDSIENHGDSVTISGGDGDDYLRNGKIFDGSFVLQPGNNVSIVGGSGNDTITNEYSVNGTTLDGGDNVSMVGGAGNDYIRNSGDSVTIDGGTGDDTIYTDYSTNVTIDGGVGDDRISLGASVSGDNVISYTLGDGNDTVWGYSDDTALLQINSSVGWSSVVSGNNIVITVGDGSITLVDAATTPADTSTATTPADTSTATTPADTSTATTPADTSTATTPADTSTATTPADTSTATTPADTSTATTPAVDPTTTTAVGQAVPTDVIFLIDKSSSMSSYIQRVKDAITSFANSLGSTNSDFRFGIVEFGQNANGGMPVAKTFTLFNGVTPYFTSNVEEFTGALNTNSDVWAEYGLSAIQTALLMFQSDPRLAQKRIVVLTDAGYEGDGSEAVDSNVTSTGIADLLAAMGVKMDVVGTLNSECQTEYEPLANGTGGKFYDINSLSYYNYFEEIADDILGRSHVNINLNTDTVPEGTASGVFVVTPVLNALGAVVPASSDATFKAAAEEGDFVVGYVVAPNAYIAVPDSPWRQIVTIPENWIVSGTWQDDALNITGSNVVVSGSLGKDNISINESVTNVNLVDVTELQNGSDTLSLSKKITPGTLQQIFTGTGVALYTTNEAGELDFLITLPGIVALDESLLNCEVSNAGTPNTIRELIYGEVNLPIFGGQDLSGRIMFAQWGYGFTPPEGNPLFVDTTLATSADLAEDFGSPTLDEISPANFAVTANDMTDQNLTAFNPNVAEAILASNKTKF